jgi:hypothetical protein
MAGTVKVPGAGRVPKGAAIAGLVAVGGLIAWHYVKKKNAATATPAATPTDQYPPDGTTGNPADPYSTDPATGATYGDEAAGSGGTFGAFGPGGSGITMGTAGTTGTGGPPFSSNSAWTNWVITQMTTQNPALNVGALTNALGLYVEGQPVTAAQKTLVDDARAIGGDPPVAGASGFPPSVRTDGGKGGHVTAHNPVAGLREAPSGKGEAKITWDKADHATGYKVSLSGGAIRHDTTSGTEHAFTGLKAGRFTASVLATPASAGARPAAIDVTVK